MGVLLFVLLAIPEPTAAQPFSFRLIRPQAPILNYGDASFGDIDGDGRQDLLALGNSRTTGAPFIPRAYHAIAAPEFHDDFSGVWRMPFAVTDLSTTLWHGSIDWYDIDGDGDLDAVATGATNPSEPFTGATILLINDGGSLVEVDADLPPLYGSTARWGDFDQDGDADLLVMGAESANIFRTVLLENDGGSFTEVDTDLPDLAFGDAVWADMDNDGDRDLILSGARSDGTFVTDVFVNTNGTFAAANAQLPKPAFSSLDLCDFDNDGDYDILVSGGRISPLLFDGLTEIYRNDNLSFSLAATLPPTFYGEALWGDYDNDGDADIVIAGTPGATGPRSVRVYQNESGSFVERAFLTGVSFASAQWSDYDGDLDLDLVVSGLDRTNSSVLNIYRNEQRVPNTAPTAPTNLSASMVDGLLRLSWDAATDEQSGSEPLTYNVRLGTSPGAGDIMSASTAAGESRRLLSGRGNADLSRVLRLDLPNGEYYWTVQAIDQSFAASPFAEEQPVQVTGKDSPTSTEDADRDRFTLGDPHPNPSRSGFAIDYTVPSYASDRRAEFTVFDLLGSVVVRATVPSRAGTWRWDGRDGRGARLAAGLYFVQLKSGADVDIRKILVTN